MAINHKNTYKSNFRAQGIMNRVRTGYRAGRAAIAAYKGYKKVKSKFRPKSGGSRTKTKNKNKTQQSWDRDGNGIAYKTTTLTYKKANQFKLRDILGEKGMMDGVFYGGNTSTQGIQDSMTVSTIAASSLGDLYTTLNNSAALPSERGIRFNVNQIRFEIEFMNCGPAAVELDIYHLVDKNTSVTAAGSTNIEWDQGLQDEQGSFAAPLRTQPWALPTSVKRFNLLFWSKRYPKSLAPGEKVKFNVYHNVNRVIDYEHVQRFATVRGITQQIFVIQRGTVGDGTLGTGFVGVPPAGGVTITRSKVAWVVKYGITGHMLATRQKRVRHIGTLPTTITTLYTQSDSAAAPQNTEDPNEYA